MTTPTALACELTAWWRLLALAGTKNAGGTEQRLRLRPFSIAGRLADHCRTRRLHLSSLGPWAELLLAGVDRFRTLEVPT